MSYWVVEAVWPARTDKVSPATSVRLEGVRAATKEQARQVALRLLPGDWTIISVREQ